MTPALSAPHGLQPGSITRVAVFLAFLLPTMLTAQSDSVRVLFRTHAPLTPVQYHPGEFNGWTLGAASQLAYDTSLAAWTRLYVFKVKDPGDARRTVSDTVFQYKFNGGAAGSDGYPTGWYPDPLTSDRNPQDNNNSLIRLTSRFWFQYYAHEQSGQVSRITMGLAHLLSDTIASVTIQHAPTQSDPLTSLDVTSSFLPSKAVLDIHLAAPIGQNDFVRLVARTTAGDSVVFARGGYAVTIAPMPAGMPHGVSGASDTGSAATGFRLWAPVGNLVLLRIAPAGQPLALTQPIVMKKNVSSADWFIFVDLAPGTYDYAFELDAERIVLDPWGRVHTGTASRFTKGPAGISADDYVWKSNAYVRPRQKDLIIYELHIGEFAGGYVGQRGTLRDMIAVLPHLDSLGINAIELMPVTDWGQPGPSGNSWGYDVSSWYAVEPSYGTPGDLKELVDSAHARGIAVILDVVFNHMTDASPLWQLAPDVSTNPYFKNPGTAYNEDGLVFFRDIDHWSVYTQEHVYQSLRMWVDEFRIDGFRYDYTQGIGWNINEPTKGILGWANRIDADYGGTVYQIAEHLPESPALVYYSGISGGWHNSFRSRMFDEARFRNQPLAQIEDQVLDLGAFQGNDTPATPSRYQDRSEPVNYTVSHDEQSLVYEMTVFQGVSHDEAIMRDKLYGTFMFTSLGVPMLWQGMETGESRGWPNEGLKLTYRPVDWTRIQTAEGQNHFQYYQRLIRHRRFNPALTDGLLRKLRRYESGGQKVLVWGMEDTLSGSAVTIVANLGATQQTVTDIPWVSNGIWHELFSTWQLPVTGTVVPSLDVPAYTAVVFTNRTDSALGIPTSVDVQAGDDVPTSLALRQNYPNPFNSSTVFRFDLPADGVVTLAVYNLLGERVDVVANGFFTRGTHTVTWHSGARGHSLSTGVYLARLEAGGRQVAQKIILLR